MSKYPGRVVTDLAPTGYSVAFDGAGDYLSYATGGSAAFNLSTGDWTIEAWIYRNASGAGHQIINLFNSAGANSGLSFYVNSSNQLAQDNGVTGTTAAGTVPANAWTHVAAVRSSGNTQLYVNGVAVGSAITQAPNTAQFFRIGITANDVSAFNGNISNLRIVKGTALYTSAFTPPTQLFNITNTSLLTCNSPAIIDQSNNAFTITVVDNAAASTFTPFPAYVPYNPALGASTPGVWTLDEALQAKGTRQWNMYDPRFNLTTLLLHGNGTNGAQNNTFLDSSSNNFTITRNPASGPNAPTQGSFSPFSQSPGYWGNYFDGVNTNYLSLASSADFAVGTTFTFECWIYPTVSPPAGGQNIFGNTASGQFSVGYNGSTAWGIAALGTAWRLTTSTMPTVNAWNHIVVARSGTGTNQTSLFLNGVRVANGTVTDAWTTSGAANIGMLSSLAFTGYISNLRLVKGTDVYGTGNVSLTVPTAPITPITNTVLLTCQSNRFIDTNTQVTAKTITVNGTPSVQSFSPFYPTAAYTPTTVGGSGYFDGTGDYLSFTNNTSTNLGTGDFTFEAWVYPVALSSFNMLFAAGGANNYFALKWGATSSIFGLNAYNGTQDVTSSSLTTPINQWTHIAFVRISGTIYFYINGVAAGSGAFTSAWGTSTGTATIGFNATYAGQYFVNGYISNLRVVKGTAVYTGAFTPPRAPLATSGSASASAYSSTTNVNTSFASSETSLLLNFTNAGIVDSTAKNVLETAGDAKISTTVSKFGGSSMFFDGTGDYLQIPSSNLLAFGSSPYTVELWLYPNNVANLQGLFTMGAFRFFQNTTGLWFLSSSSTIISVATGLSTGQWFHIALVREGTGTSQTKLYLNGSSIGTGTDANTWAAAIAYVGSEGASNQLNGYIDDLRITRFARYTGNFTPQTSQWQDE